MSIDSNANGINQLIVEPTIPDYAKESYDPKINIALFVPFQTVTIFVQALLVIIFFAIFVSLKFNNLLNKNQFPTLNKFLSDIFLVLFTIKLLSFIDKVKQMVLDLWWHK